MRTQWFFLMMALAGSALRAQKDWREIEVPKHGPYFKELEERARKKDLLAMWELFSKTHFMSGAMWAEDGSFVDSCAKWPNNAIDLMRKGVKELEQRGDLMATLASCRGSRDPDDLQRTVKVLQNTKDPFLVAKAISRSSRDETPLIKEKLVWVQKEMTKLANEGDRRAMYELVFGGIGGRSLESHYFSKILAEKDSLAARAAYAWVVYHRYDPEDSKPRAMLEKSAEWGYPPAMREVATGYYEGEAIPENGPKFQKDLLKAWHWMRRYREVIGCPPPEVLIPIDSKGKHWRLPPGVKVAPPAPAKP